MFKLKTKFLNANALIKLFQLCLLKLLNNVKNTFFQTKQFKINHSEVTLKVTTEALILGAYAAIQPFLGKSILEIGTGTGLLPLMLAQKLSADIDTVEIDYKSYLLAKENIENSRFNIQIKLFHSSIQSFKPDKFYDLIISNPPFFPEHLKSEKSDRNTALHTEELSFEDLTKAVVRLLSNSGKFIVLLPPYQMSQIQSLLKDKNLIKTDEFHIHHKQNSKVLRIIATFEYKMQTFDSVDFYIKDINENYTEQFIALLKDYYLIFE
jgi:tRNA1Val (adenine37-N6)-methyltransferase